MPIVYTCIWFAWGGVGRGPKKQNRNFYAWLHLHTSIKVKLVPPSVYINISWHSRNSKHPRSEDRKNDREFKMKETWSFERNFLLIGRASLRQRYSFPASAPTISDIYTLKLDLCCMAGNPKEILNCAQETITFMELCPLGSYQGHGEILQIPAKESNKFFNPLYFILSGVLCSYFIRGEGWGGLRGRDCNF